MKFICTNLLVLLLATATFMVLAQGKPNAGAINRDDEMVKELGEGQDLEEKVAHQKYLQILFSSRRTIW